MIGCAVRSFALFFALLLIGWSDAANLQAKEKEVLDKIFKDYDVRIRPEGVNATGDHDPVVVNVNLYVRSITEIDDVNMEYHLQVTFRQSWTDKRFQFNDMGGKLKYLTLNDVSKVWTPDLFFSNEKEGSTHDLLTPNLYIRIFPDGQVLYSTRVSLVLSCPMNLQLFPFDNQVCTMRMASYGFTTDDLLFIWKEDAPVQMVKNLHLPGFDLSKFMTDYCNSKTTTGEYSCLRVDFHFARHFRYYLISMYIPSTMLVMVSWVVFWLHHSAIGARVVLGVTTLLGMTFFTAWFATASARVNYTTALDTWTGVCLTFLFLALMETATVNYFPRWSICKSRKKEEQGGEQGGEEGNNMDLKPLVDQQTPPQQQPTDDAPATATTTRTPTGGCKQRANRYTRLFTDIPTLSEKFDVLARVIFPFMFFVFVIFYSAVHSTLSSA